MANAEPSPYRTRLIRRLMHWLPIGKSSSLIHVTYGTATFNKSLELLKRSARHFGIRNIRIYRPDDPVIRRAVEENPAIMREERGAGYWLWKSYIILDALERAPDGTLVFYSDAGVTYISDPAPLLSLADRRDIVLFDNMRAIWTQRMWTKRECFVLLNADAPIHWDRRQLDAAFQLYRAGPRARAFVAELKEASRDPRVLSDAPNTCGLPNFTEFREHRHDQSVLTIFAVRHGIETFRTPKAPPEQGDSRSPYPQIFDHRRRF
jgi:hypothetical protein